MKVRFNSINKYRRVFAVIGLLAIVFYIVKNKHVAAHRQFEREDTKHFGHEVLNKLILEWTPFFGTQDFIPPLETINCPNLFCSFTSNRSLLNDSAAVLFHLNDINYKDLPPTSYRNSKQRWVLLNHEAPPNNGRVTDLLNTAFNWTITYRFDSDIVLTPKCTKTEVGSGSLGVAYPRRQVGVWAASNCRSASRRERLVKRLQHYLAKLAREDTSNNGIACEGEDCLPIDVYGHCGKKQCLPKMSADCYRMMGQRYYFYLAFENSICRDYVTEKFFNALEYGMVPVVLGGANYSAFAPPNSFIDARAFPHPRALARFLLSESRDRERYNAYHRWRHSYKCSVTYPHFACALCEKLHNNSNNQEWKYYPDFNAWWFDQANCVVWKEP